MKQQFKEIYYPAVAEDDWNDWHWQMRHKITDVAEANRVFNLSAEEKQAIETIKASANRVPFGVTPYYAGAVKDTAVRKGVIPSLAEIEDELNTVEDPLGEEARMTVPNLVHRYKDRALFLVSNVCPAYCRYCTRGRRVGRTDISMSCWEQPLAYIKEHTEIRDVLISGGEPLLLCDEKIDALLTALRAIPHVEIIRIGTKAPVSLPQRITPALVAILKKHNPVFLSVHFNHASEITPEVSTACNLLADNGILLGSQTVLLKGINDDADTLITLMHELLKIRVKPYYLFQCDAVKGAGHFIVPLRKGIAIIDAMRSKTGGYSIPTYAVDLPNTSGKIAIYPDHIIESGNGNLSVRDFDGTVYIYNVA